ncbi:MAG: hypothetical protein PHI85_00160 [Victivallaceae bacterium]|nr:hypothetical protein [Victivallaceae bacterium]
MKIFLFMLALLSVAALPAAELSDLEKRLLGASGELRIADTVGNDPVVRRAALGWVSANRNVNITIEQAALKDVTGEGAKKEYDVVIYQYDPRRKDNLLPKGKSSDYAADAALIYVNRENKISGIATAELVEMFGSAAAGWEKINGDTRSPRRYGTVRPAAGEKPFRLFVLGDSPYTDAMMFVGTAGEVAAGASGSPAAIGFGGYSYALPEDVKMVAVDGVEPSPENLRSGKYPLQLRRSAAAAGDNPLGKLFSELLLSPEAGSLAAEAELFPLVVSDGSI